MARLNVPPAFTRIAASVSKPVNPAAFQRRAPSQSAASISRSSVAARPSSVVPAASRAASAIFVALQQERSALVSAAFKRANSGASIRALGGFKRVGEKKADVKQKKILAKTRIPRPEPMPAGIAKWTHTREFLRLAKVSQKVVAETKEDVENELTLMDDEDTVIITRDLGGAAFTGIREMAPERTEEKREDCEKQELAQIEDTPNHCSMWAIIEDGGRVTFPDNNPDLLHDVSFDDTIDAYQQSSCPEMMRRMSLLLSTVKQGGKVAKCPPRLRRRVKLDSARLRSPSKIPRPQVVKPQIKAKKSGRPAQMYSAPRKRKHLPGRLIYDMAFKPELNNFGDMAVNNKGVSIDGSSQIPHVDELLAQPTDSLQTTAVDLRPDSAVDMEINSEDAKRAVSMSVPEPIQKVLRFSDAPVEPILFSRSAPAADLQVPLDVGDTWLPLKMKTRYPGSAQAIGFKTMFEVSSRKTICLKRRVLHRFKAVQEYEKRRKQEATTKLADGEYPPLGQLEYGNADFKISLQAKKVITASDIGMYKDPSEVGRGILSSIYNPLNGPLLHFGGFKDEYEESFEDVDVPAAATAAYKKPVRWVKARTEAKLESWIKRNFKVMQQADLET